MLTPVKELDDDPGGFPVMVERDRQFLSVRPDGDGQVVEVLGDLGRARNVAVLVPGMGNSLESLHDLAGRADTVRTEAGPGTATVVWLGYDSPGGVIPAASKRSAYTAAPALRRFSAGLETEVRPDANTTLIGHSYGSVVVGHALRHGARFDNVILTGSPGIDPDVHSVAELGVPGTRFFAARSPGDFVSYTRPGFVTRDQGPINPGALFDGSGPPTVCSVTVETGDPSRTDAGAEQVAAAGRVLRERGWQVEPPELEAGHHRVAATRAGFEVAIHAWDGDWKVTLVGETPLPE